MIAAIRTLGDVQAELERRALCGEALSPEDCEEMAARLREACAARRVRIGAALEQVRECAAALEAATKRLRGVL